MTEAILEQDSILATDARNEHGREEPSHGVAIRPLRMDLRTWLPRPPSENAGYPAIVTASEEHGAGSTEGSGGLSTLRERFHIAALTETALLLHVGISKETCTTSRFSTYSDSEPDYFFLVVTEHSGQASRSLTNEHDAGERDVRPVRTKSFWTEAERMYRRFRDDLVRALEDVPIEDGMQHPADELIERALGASESSCIERLARAFREFYTPRPAMSAAILRCVARVDFDQTGTLGLNLAQEALSHEDVELREAAVRAFESWGGVEARDVLSQHHDCEPWLDEYVRQVVLDLSEATS